nr:MAG TPA: hypothetical protein [Caudoviricetes sp.]
MGKYTIVYNINPLITHDSVNKTCIPIHPENLK